MTSINNCNLILTVDWNREKFNRQCGWCGWDDMLVRISKKFNPLIYIHVYYRNIVTPYWKRVRELEIHVPIICVSGVSVLSSPIFAQLPHSLVKLEDEGSIIADFKPQPNFARGYICLSPTSSTITCFGLLECTINFTETLLMFTFDLSVTSMTLIFFWLQFFS